MNPTNCFTLNTQWWETKESRYKNHILRNLGYYDRDDIIEENPLADLVNLNKYVITIDSQDSKKDIPMVCHPKFINQEMSCSNDKVRLFRYKDIEAVTLQRTYIIMWCRNTEQAYKIIDAVKDICYYVYQHNKTVDCSEIFETEGMVNVTTILWPLRFDDDKPLFVTPTNIQHPKMFDYKMDLDTVDDIKEAIFPESMCQLELCTKLYSMAPDNYTLPDSYECGEHITEDLYKKILNVFQH